MDGVLTITAEELEEIRRSSREHTLAAARADLARAAFQVLVAEIASRHGCMPQDIQLDGKIRRGTDA